MPNFNEHSLEMSIMELFQEGAPLLLNGEQIHRERRKFFLRAICSSTFSIVYAKDGSCHNKNLFPAYLTRQLSRRPDNIICA